VRVALYYPWVYLHSGVERMILETVRRSRHEWVIFTSHYNADQTFKEFKDLPVVELRRLSVDRGYLPVAGAALTILKQKIDLENFDALVVSSEGLGDLITFRNHSIPVICYCHTPLAVVHDPYMRQTYLNSNKVMMPLYYFFANIFKLVDRFAWRNYDYVFCNSMEARKRILKSKLAPNEKIEILNPGLDVNLMKPTWQYENYFLVVSRFKWVKNLELAITGFQEFKRLHPQFSDFRLRILGLVEPRSEEYFRWLQELAGNDKDIVFERNPSDQDILAAYESCFALLFTSPNEVWGMVPLEAMGFGKPVIAVNRGGPQESVIDGETGFLVDDTPAAFAAAMARLAGQPELARKFGEKAATVVKKYDWDFFVERLDSYLDGIKRT
jgi:glycosyltransferase involved in cell wall biosynthesis